VWSPQGLIAMHYPEMWGEVLFVDAMPGDPAAAVRAAPELEEIRVANLLMAVYHRQRQYRELTGAFAIDLPALGIPAGRLPFAVDAAGGEPETMEMPPEWSLTMDASPDRFLARLVTPIVTATVDQEGRLLRSPP
jgi:hypothetical protein